MFEFLLNFQNLDLFSVGAAVAGMLLLGFVVLFGDVKSATNRTFLWLTITASAWGMVNYAVYQPFYSEDFSLILLRIAVFFSVWAAFSTFTFIYVFPNKKLELSWPYVYVLIPITIFVSFIALTPFVFQSVTELTAGGSILTVLNGPGIYLYGALITFFNAGSVILLIKKLLKKDEKQNKQLQLILVGVALMLALITTFNFILPAFFNNSSFIALGGIFQFPFIVLASYAILRHGLFNVKVAGAALLVLALSVLTLGEVINAGTLGLVLFRISIFILVLIFGINLIRSVIREVKQRERIEKLAKDLEVANKRLKELDRQKSEFVSIASHQLRSPITAIRGYISLIIEKEFGDYPQAIREPLDRILESSRLMVKSIEDYLNISRIEQGRMKYEMSDFDISKLSKTVVNEYKPIADKKGLDIMFSGPEKNMVHADIGKIKQVIANLVDNSIKYTPAGNINVKATAFEGKARITVSDTGVGLEKEDLGDLFNKFVRARGANKINTSGTGLGLYVAKQMIEAHKGKIWVESDGKGKGSRFIFELPIATS
ncbi:hypothetical protein COB87_002605 [Candidatus Wolfebacteria bacterium]|nr:hypothetical protein [Candidatus Wolfebacteria bacterium]